MKYDPELISEFLTDKLKKKTKVKYAYHSEADSRIIYELLEGGMGATDLVAIINWL